MNRKFGLLLFAIGVGVASAPAFANSCESFCIRTYKICRESGADLPTCIAQEEDCIANCDY